MISFKQYLLMLAVGPCLLSFVSILCYDVVLYPRENCENLSVDPEAVKMLKLPVETQLAACGKRVIGMFIYMPTLCNHVIISFSQMFGSL